MLAKIANLSSQDVMKCVILIKLGIGSSSSILFLLFDNLVDKVLIMIICLKYEIHM